MIDYKDVGDKYDEIIEFNQKAIQELTTALRDCRDELCLICGDKWLDYYDKNGKRKSCCSKCRWSDEDWND